MNLYPVSGSWTEEDDCLVRRQNLVDLKLPELRET